MNYLLFLLFSFFLSAEIGAVRMKQEPLIVQVGKSRLILKNGDITQERADFIVNAANKALLGGGGVDGAIHSAAGTEIDIACRKFPIGKSGFRSQAGEAKMTPAGNLPASVVIQAVGPCISPSYAECISIEEARPLLQTVYKTALTNAEHYLTALKQNKKPSQAFWPEGVVNAKDKELLRKLQNGEPISISFPTISTGLFGFPKKEAALIALTQVLEHIQQTKEPMICEFYFIFFQDRTGMVAEDRKFYEEFLKTKSF
jgi:O-acetyl-ADP-ribose deacetylase